MPGLVNAAVGLQRLQAEQRAFAARDLPGVDCVCLRADGIQVNIGAEEHRLCLLVMIGVLAALAEGHRESAGSWAELLRGCARCGVRPGAAGDGAVGLWNGLRGVFPQAKEGRCWFRKTASVLAALPESAHPGATEALAEIWDAVGKTCARAAVTAFEAAYGAKFPEAAAKVTGDAGTCPPSATTPQGAGSICGPPARLSRPSPPSGTGPRSPGARAGGRPGWRAAGLAMAFELIESARDRWRALSAPRLVALVRAGAAVTGGKLIERPAQQARPEAA